MDAEGSSYQFGYSIDSLGYGMSGLGEVLRPLRWWVQTIWNVPR